MIRVSNIKLPIHDSDIKSALIRKLGAAADDVVSYKIAKKSVDARRKNDIKYIYSVDAEVKNSKKYLKLKDVAETKEFHYEYMTADFKKRPVVIGFGPAGMFAALILAEGGARPIVLERGKSVDERSEDVEKLKKFRILNPESNIQFGEGGAGTFSDGKLTTGIKDKACRFVLETFAAFGAPEEILYLAKPHIGTDNLKLVVKNIRNRIISLGGEVRFRSRVTGFDTGGGRLKGVFVSGDYIETDTAILAVGHSARDTFKTLYASGFPMEQKPFAVGVRIEHLQKDIGFACYGEEYKNLPAASYKLVSHAGSRGVYTFCMCPGGEVVPAASEEGMLVTNGMSEFARAGENANSALLVGIPPDSSGNPLRGIELQRRMEKAAYTLGGGGYKAPVQLVGDFLADRESRTLGDIYPTYKPGFTLCDLRECLPGDVAEALKAAIPDLGRRLDGFDRNDAVMTGVESRSSSPVRIIRNENKCSPLCSGLYPCGEGAGYAGGIVSAAADGIHCAEAAILSIRKK
mgnify:FL=1